MRRFWYINISLISYEKTMRTRDLIPLDMPGHLFKQFLIWRGINHVPGIHVVCDDFILDRSMIEEFNMTFNYRNNIKLFVFLGLF
ncbi:U7 putative protein [Boteke virus]|uniref:Uncharacterized protein n=1 Tax=Boteke virus TaxID=864698 RepID=A0AAE9BMF1_9RHAB|nr:U7 putative protein [Boteke virus]UAU42850.1 U7 putative protein [Boteke virus]